MTTKYEMWMTYNSEAEKIQFPVLPETFSVKNGSNNDSVDITGLGEIVIMQSRPAVQISFSSFFPATRFPGIQVSTITKPLTLVQKICEWKAGDKPVHFLLTACGVDLHMTIESFNYDEVGGDPEATTMTSPSRNTGRLPPDRSKWTLEIHPPPLINPMLGLTIPSPQRPTPSRVGIACGTSQRSSTAAGPPTRKSITPIRASSGETPI